MSQEFDDKKNTSEFKKKPKAKISKTNICIYFLALICALLYYIYSEYDKDKNEQISRQILNNMHNEYEYTQYEEDNEVVDNNKLLEEFHNTKEVKIGLTKQINNSNYDIQTIAPDGTKYFSEAILKINSLGIEYPILSETSDALLKISLNKIWGPNPNEVGNYCIAGHNYKNGRMLGTLKKIEIGDMFTLEDLYGRKLSYKVYDKYLIEPDDKSCTSQKTDGKKEVTLITCQNVGTKRLVVKARAVA